MTVCDWRLLKPMYGDLTDAEVQAFAVVADHFNLDPLAKQIHAVVRYVERDGRKIRTIVYQTGIDGFRVIADRTKCYCPGPTRYAYDQEGKLVSAHVVVKKKTDDGLWHECEEMALLNEFIQRDRQGNPVRFWRLMGHVMLSKCAEVRALRRAFPQDLAGLYLEEEMEQGASDPQPTEVKPVPAEAPQDMVAVVQGWIDKSNGIGPLYALGQRIRDSKKLTDEEREICAKRLSAKIRAMYQEWILETKDLEELTMLTKSVADCEWLIRDETLPANEGDAAVLLTLAESQMQKITQET